MEDSSILQLPLLALRGLTLFPGMTIHFDVGRNPSVQALDEAMSSGSGIFLVSQRNLSVEEPEEGDLYQVGTLANIRQILRMPGDMLRVMVEGTARGRLLGLTQSAPYLQARVEALPSAPPGRSTPRTEALIRQVYTCFERYAELSEKVNSDVLLKLLSSEDAGFIADTVAQNTVMRTGSKQELLEELHPVRRLEKLHRMLRRENEILEFEHGVQERVRDTISASQKNYYLREQIRALQTELGEGESGESDIADYRRRIAAAKLPGAVAEKLNKEVDRLEKQPFGSSEGAVIRGYLDLCLELPWGKKTRERLNVHAARRQLDADHFGLEKVKERILEHLAVRQLAPELKGQVLCLVGPPGVGKTSVAMSVAKALNRRLGRISLGGVHDEAEIRGHRKTYIGAMPGRIIEGIRQAGSCNPVLLLDEIDKVGSDHRGDPASALLEVLDGEQNAAFRDNFLEVPFDLSDVLFLTTANTTSTIPRPLLDRMEIIELSSYTDEEKLEIAKRHLLPRQRRRHGLKSAQLKVSDGALRQVITGYTRESGVRTLEREMAGLCRKCAMEVVEKGVKSVSITEQNLEHYLGVRKYTPEPGRRAGQVGVVNGLAWTSVGGSLLEVEVNALPGSGKLELTGNLGDVMKESARTALSYIRSRAEQLGIAPDFYKTTDLHIHFPEGAVPKDGPSAGITVATAMVSALTNTPVRGSLAMTGEITLRGRVLAIGGLREKTMAALRGGMTTVILPADNQKDLEEIDQTVRAALHFVSVETADQVLAAALDVDLLRREESPAPPRDNALPAGSGLGLKQ